MNQQRLYPIERSRERGPGAASRTLAAFMFASRWLQAPLYIGLIIAQAVYVVLFYAELYHLFQKVVITGKIEEVDVMLGVLALIDIVMIANLLIMVIIGGYETFVSRIRVQGHHDEPDWLSHVNANVLKVKLAISIISISSIHLLKTFIEISRIDEGVLKNFNGTIAYTTEGVFWEVVIHLAFIVSALALAAIDKMSQSTQHEQLDHTPFRRHSKKPQANPQAHASDYITVRIPNGAALPEGAEIVHTKD